MIGIDVNRAAFIAALDACWLSDAEFTQGPVGWAQLPDPITPWEIVYVGNDEDVA